MDARETSLRGLEALAGRGRALKAALDADPGDAAARHEARLWQEDCAGAVNELSGGSKAHWVSRGYSEALLVRGRNGAAPIEADVSEIVARILDVLARASSALRTAVLPDEGAAETPAPHPHRFDFVHDTKLRPVLEESYRESARLFDEGDFTASMMTTCGIIEAVITDAIRARQGAPDPTLARSPFMRRIELAETIGAIRGGCARLTPVARAYREIDFERPESAVVTARDARIARQVLNVVMRDLDPGR